MNIDKLSIATTSQSTKIPYEEISLRPNIENKTGKIFIENVFELGKEIFRLYQDSMIELFNLKDNNYKLVDKLGIYLSKSTFPQKI